MLCSILRGITLLFVLLLSGCGTPLTEAQIHATEEAKLLQSFIDKLQRSDLPAARMLLDAQTNGLPETAKALEQSAEIMPNENPKSTQYLNWWMNTDTASGRTSGVSAQLEYTTRWVLVTANFAGQPELMKATGFTVQYAPTRQDGASPFTTMPSATGPAHILNITIAAITVVVMLVGVVMCVLVQGLNKKWLWILFILFCTPGVYVESANGNFMLNVIDFGWADGSWFQPLSGLHLIVPLGALVFFRKLWNLRKPLEIERTN